MVTVGFVIVGKTHGNCGFLKNFTKVLTGVVKTHGYCGFCQSLQNPWLLGFFFEFHQISNLCCQNPWLLRVLSKLAKPMVKAGF